MKAYRALIKPQICYPDQHYNAVCRDLEEDGKWYSEEEKEAIKKKYKHLENTFEQVVFDVKYEPIDAIPVEWLETAISKFKTAGRADAVEIVQSLIKAWKSEEELKGLLEAQLECMAKQIFEEMDEKGKNAIIEKLGYVPWSDEEGRKKND